MNVLQKVHLYVWAYVVCLISLEIRNLLMRWNNLHLLYKSCVAYDYITEQLSLNKNLFLLWQELKKIAVSVWVKN